MRGYSFVFGGINSVASGNCFLQMVAPSGTGFAITELYVGQTGVTASTMCEIQLQRRSTAATMTAAAVLAKDGTAQTSTTGLITPMDEMGPLTILTGTTTTNAVSAGGTAGGTLVSTPFRWTWNLLSPLFICPVPNNILTVKPGGIITLAFPTAPGASPTFQGYLEYEELN